MQYTNFGPTGMVVSRLVLGGMTFGGRVSYDESARIVDEALDRGVNFIDTAESYGRRDSSEDYLGRILAGKRDKVYLATKVYSRRAYDGRTQRNSRNNIITSLERSLRLLRTDYVDLYQLHHPDPQTPLAETLATLDRLVDAGKVRHVGVCNHYAWQAAYMLAAAGRRGGEPIVSMQCRYNILDRPLERETLPFVRRFGLATMMYSPLCEGLLTGKYKRDEPPPAGSRGTQNPLVAEALKDPRVFDIIDRLGPIAERNDLSLPQLAMLWVLARPGVTTAIMGGSKPEHYRLMLDIADRELPEEDTAAIDELSADRADRPFVNQPRVEGAPPMAW
ncbi:MAG: aldo/keto reductase [Planctomycetota bacterium]